MWHALRAELAYFRPWLLGGLAIATFVSVLLSVLARVVDDADGIPGFLPAMFPIIAGMVVAFIAQSCRADERRARLLLSGPLTPRQLAVVMVLLPPCLVGLGVLFSLLMIGLAVLVTGELETGTLRFVAGFGVQFLGYAQLGPLTQEATAARRQRRTRAAVIGWAVFALAIPFLAAAQLDQTRFMILRYPWHLVVVVALMAATVALYQRRTDFTR